MADRAPFRIDPTQTAAFEALRDIPVDFSDQEFDAVEPLRAVVIGGGTGAPVSIRSLLSLGIQTDAVVAMADDGGSTGILREAADATPPGDVRKCIAAFADDPYDPLVKAFKYRIEIADGHALGNLMLAALEDACGSFAKAIEICEQLLGAQGHVLPSTFDHVHLRAQTRDGKLLEGQALSSHSSTALQRISLVSDSGTITPNRAAIRAIEDADLIVLGPGSLFTSIIANLAVPGILEAIAESRASTLFICSVADSQGETWGLSALEHVQALLDHGMEGMLDYVLLHSKDAIRRQGPMDKSFTNIAGLEQEAVSESFAETSITLGPNSSSSAKKIMPVYVDYDELKKIQALGPVAIVRDLADSERPTWHSPSALRSSILQTIGLMQSRSDEV